MYGFDPGGFMRPDEFDLIIDNLPTLIVESTQSLLDEIPETSEALTSEKVINIIKSASKTGLVSGWIIGKMLQKVDDAIFKKVPGFKFDSLTQWFDEYEDQLPFKRSQAKVYRIIAEKISIEYFAQLGFRRSNALLGIKNDKDREKIMAKAITKGLSTEQIIEEKNKAIYRRLKKPGIVVSEESEPATKPATENKPENMYKFSVLQWNVFKGCGYDCVYCKESFQSQEKRDFHNCRECRDYIPHAHPEYLVEDDYPLPPTPYMRFIFVGASGDISFCKGSDRLDKHFQYIIDRIANEQGKNFLLQSKDPDTFNRIKRIPSNLTLGITLETNRDEGYDKISKAPSPSKRYGDFLHIKHKFKMLTLEPMLKFDLPIMLEWINNIRPDFIWIGTDYANKSYIAKHGLEAPIDDVMKLYYILGMQGYLVQLKDKLIERINDESK